VDLAAKVTSKGTSPLILRTAVPVFTIISGSLSYVLLKLLFLNFHIKPYDILYLLHFMEQSY